MRRSGRQFDVIQMTGVVTWAGLSSGAYVLSENYVYTVEAFRDLLSHLESDGILAVSRFRLTPARETLRVVAIAYRALDDLGAAEPADHVAVMSLNPVLAMVLVKRSPLTAAEVATLEEVAAEADGSHLRGAGGRDEFGLRRHARGIRRRPGGGVPRRLPLQRRAGIRRPALLLRVLQVVPVPRTTSVPWTSR